MTIGERIREARTAKGLTQEQLAEQVHVTKQAVYKYETGIVTNIPLDKLESIAACLGVAPGYLAGWQGSPAGGTGRFDSGRTHCRLPEPERPTDPGPIRKILPA